METKELKIQIPEGYEIDKENSTFEKIVFKKKETNKPRSWEEYCANTKRNGKYLISIHSDIISTGCRIEPLDATCDKNVLPSKELAEAFRAMMQLMSLRHDWIHKWSIDNGLTEDWEPDWSNEDDKWCLTTYYNKVTICEIGQFSHFSNPLSFPTKEIVEEFKDYFKDLLEIAKQLL